MGLLRILIAALLVVLVWWAVGALRGWWGREQLQDDSAIDAPPNPLIACRQCGTYLPQGGLDPHGRCAQCSDGGTSETDRSW